MKFSFNTEIQSPVIDRYVSTLEWIKNDSITDKNAYTGEALIERKIFSIDSMLIKEVNIFDVVVFEDGNNVKMRIYPFPGGYLEYKINKTLYTLKIKYWDSLKNYGAKGIDVKFDRSQLIFKDDSFQKGDTVLGYIKLYTKPYLRNDQAQFDTYEGYFTSIIFPKDSLMKNKNHSIAIENSTPADSDL